MRKKILIAATVALLSLSSVSVMAANSPVATDYYSITIGTTVGTTEASTVKVTGGTVSSTTGAVEVGKDVTFTATPDAGYRFDKWEFTNGTYLVVSGDVNATTITITPTSDVSVNAIFVADATETTTVAEATTTAAVETTTVATETTTATTETTTTVVETTTVETATDADEEPATEEEPGDITDDPEEDDDPEEGDVPEEETVDVEEGTTVAPDSSTTSPQTGLPVAGVVVTLLASGGVAIAAKKRF